MNARERIVEALTINEAADPTYGDMADAVLAVLPELLTDDAIVEAAYVASHSRSLVAAEDPTGQSTGAWQRWKASLRAAAEALTAPP